MLAFAWPLPENGTTFEVEFPEVEPADKDFSIPSASISHEEEVEETEQNDDEQLPKCRWLDKAKAVS